MQKNSLLHVALIAGDCSLPQPDPACTAVQAPIAIGSDATRLIDPR